MISRVADSLYWLSRYMERAEDTTRFLNVNFHALLDLPGQEPRQAWAPIVGATGDEDLFAQAFDEYSTRNVMEFLLWHPANPNAVVTCISRARENARSVREQISSEMWEHVNRLYFQVREVSRASVLREPHDFFGKVRDGSHAFQGVTHATMPHGDGFQFIQLGKHVERCDKTTRILDVKYAALDSIEEGSSAAQMQLMALLRSCSALEAYRKYAQQLQAWRVIEFLLLNDHFPRSVRFCLDSCQDAVNVIAAFDEGARPATHGGLGRLFGRMCADLEYVDIHDVVAGDVHRYLDQIVQRLYQAGDEITRAYFNTQVILPGARRSLQQVQQQQQQQQ